MQEMQGAMSMFPRGRGGYQIRPAKGNYIHTYMHACIHTGNSSECKKCRGQCLCFRVEGEGTKSGLPKGLWRYAVDKGLMLVGGSIPDGASAVEWAVSMAVDSGRVSLRLCVCVCLS
jgi:hypothetical protein